METIVIVGQQKILVVSSESLGQVLILMWNDMLDNSNCDSEVVGDEINILKKIVKEMELSRDPGLFQVSVEAVLSKSLHTAVTVNIL